MKPNNVNPNSRHAFALVVAIALIIGLNGCKTPATLDTLATQTTLKKEPVKMILDSDFGSSTDDLFALMMLNHYMDNGLVDLKGIVVDREGEKNAALAASFPTTASAT